MWNDTTVACHVRVAYFADNNTRKAALFVVWMMTACGNAAMVCQVSATCCNRSSGYARQSDIAAVKDGRPEAGVLATDPPLSTLADTLWAMKPALASR